ncbi:hypothetical protein BC830DRAFT_401190 [Chytriomyces sp. MP71]|nr:hypothetical protein BC830DRAFT_401190 [Chytriomyces sp. MP71]
MGRLFYLEYINIEHNVLSGDVPFILTSFKESYYDYNCFTSQVLRSNYCDLPPEAFGGTSPPTGNWTSIAALIGGFVAVAVMCFLVTAYFLYRRVYPKSTFEFPPHVPSERSSRGSSSLRSSRSQTSVYTCTDNDEFLRASAAEAYPPPAFEACARGASAVIKEWTFLPLASRTAGGTEGVPLAAMETPSLTVQDTARCGAVVKAEDAGACAGALIIPGEDVFRWSAEEAAAWAAGLPQFGDALGLAFRGSLSLTDSLLCPFVDYPLFGMLDRV